MTADGAETAAQPETDVVVVVPTETIEEGEPPLVSTTEPEATAAPLIVQAPVASEDVADQDPQETVTAEETSVEDEPALIEEEAPAATDLEETPAPADEVETAEAAAAPARSGPVRVNRIGVAPSAPAGEEAAVVATESPAEDIPALRQFAVEFENPEGLPLLSLVLVDDGAVPDAADKFAALGFAPTVVIDALAADASDKMAEYRAAGVEVAMQISLPDGAQPTDVEIAFAAAFDILPETVLVFSDGTGFLQSDRNLTAQAMAVLAAEGRGFVAVQRGLGSAVRDAADAGVPAAAVERQIDGNGAQQNAIVRALDQAAFRARQSGGAVLAGSVTPETLAALQEWAATVDRDQLLIAPASALLLSQTE
ncbi:divergent polysaccharide deacetylase family protein [Loktanella sp. Alg231-35]|uniref:divergent polysaccharide deacetylase family protein n=1 Tax=Loktanella sp. Alg231-35 TaxID=1922220 RepID=UPI00359369FB